MLGDFSLSRAADREVGVAALVIGAARLFQINQAAGAFSSLGMILNALMTPISISLARIALAWNPAMSVIGASAD